MHQSGSASKPSNITAVSYATGNRNWVKSSFYQGCFLLKPPKAGQSDAEAFYEQKKEKMRDVYQNINTYKALGESCNDIYMDIKQHDLHDEVLSFSHNPTPIDFKQRRFNTIEDLWMTIVVIQHLAIELQLAVLERFEGKDIREILAKFDELEGNNLEAIENLSQHLINATADFYLTLKAISSNPDYRDLNIDILYNILDNHKLDVALEKVVKMRPWISHVKDDETIYHDQNSINIMEAFSMSRLVDELHTCLHTLSAEYNSGTSSLPSQFAFGMLSPNYKPTQSKEYSQRPPRELPASKCPSMDLGTTFYYALKATKQLITFLEHPDNTPETIAKDFERHHRFTYLLKRCGEQFFQIKDTVNVMEATQALLHSSSAHAPELWRKIEALRNLPMQATLKQLSSDTTIQTQGSHNQTANRLVNYSEAIASYPPASDVNITTSSITPDEQAPPQSKSFGGPS